MSDMVVSRRRNAAIIEVSGRLDSANAVQFADLVSSVLAGGANLVLDLSELDYLSGDGLRELVAALRRARHASGDLRLAQPSEPVYETLEIAGFRAIFRIYHSLEDAVNSYSSR